MTLNELVREAHSTAKTKGWHDTTRTPLEVHMLIVSEIAEATETVRSNQAIMGWIGEKPEGEAVELADAIIRIADYFGARGWDLEEVIRAKLRYNQTRPYRHGGNLV